MIQCLFCKLRIDLLSLSKIRHWSFIFFESSMNSLSVTRIHYESIFLFTNLLWFHCQIREFTINSLSVTQIRYGFIIFVADWLWIDYREFTMNNFLFCEFTYHFLCIHNLFRELTMYSLSVTRIYYGFITYFPNSLRISFINSF